MHLVPSIVKATIALDPGVILCGRSVGARGLIANDVVFNTSITGYQETATDPSYLNQVVVFAFPHVGNSGVNPNHMESKDQWTSSIIVRAISTFCSGTKLVGSFTLQCQKAGTMLITGVDTRKIVRLVRANGTTRACIITDCHTNLVPLSVAKALKYDRTQDAFASTTASRAPTTWFHKVGYASLNCHKLAVLDFGAKYSIFRNLARRGCDLIVVSPNAKAGELLKLGVMGLLLTNGPGDPRAAQKATANVIATTPSNIASFGICFGHQVVALCSGARVKQLNPGHHGTNHPVKSFENKRILITSQNHNYSVNQTRGADYFKITHVSLFDESVQGLESYKRPTIGFQGHPEACPGPSDASYLFDKFLKAVRFGRQCNYAKTV